MTPMPVTDKAARLARNTYIVRDKLLIRMGFRFPADKRASSVDTLLAAGVDNREFYSNFECLTS